MSIFQYIRAAPEQTKPRHSLPHSPSQELYQSPSKERVMRFEPTTFTLATWRSTTELHPHNKYQIIHTLVRISTLNQENFTIFLADDSVSCSGFVAHYDTLCWIRDNMRRQIGSGHLVRGYNAHIYKECPNWLAVPICLILLGVK